MVKVTTFIIAQFSYFRVLLIIRKANNCADKFVAAHPCWLTCYQGFYTRKIPRKMVKKNSDKLNRKRQRMTAILKRENCNVQENY